MPAHRLLWVFVLLPLFLIWPVDVSVAVPFSTLTIHASIPSQSGTQNPCDEINCEGETSFFQTLHFPQFGLAGKTLLSVQLAYDFQATTETIGINNTSVARSFRGDADALASLINFPIVFVTSNTRNIGPFVTLQPGQLMSLTTTTARVADTLVFPLGTTQFPSFLGDGDVSFFTHLVAGEGSLRDLTGCTPQSPSFCGRSFAPIVYSYMFSGAIDLTYIYCIPGVDAGCPSSDPAFFSQAPAPPFAGSAKPTPIPALTFDESTGRSGTNQSNQTVGWRFDVLHPFTLNELGWFDEGGDGLRHSHTVDLWDPLGTLLASAVVPAGTAAALNGQYRMVGISPITLAPGTGYIIGGENFDTGGDRLAFDVAELVRSDFITYDHPTFSNLGTGFVRPTQDSIALTGFYGPMFGGAIPEPSTLVLVALGVAMLGLRAPRWLGRYPGTTRR